MNLNELPDIEFVNSDKDEIQAIILSIYKQVTGRQLAQGDPVRLFILVITNVIILLLNKINETGKQNLLKYATGENLDHLGVLVGVARAPAAKAVTTVEITMANSSTSLRTIPKGTRVTAGDGVFFELLQEASVLPGHTTVTAQFYCTATGESGNNYAPGEITTLVDPLPYVQSVRNTTKSQSGADIEDDERYRDRIHNAPESFSCAGAEGAYEFFAKKASQTIIDVKTISPKAGEVVIYPLLEKGQLPEQEILTKVEAMCNQTHVRPLTDKVSAKAPGQKSYDINLTYYINRADQTQASIIQANVEKSVEEYVVWQRSAMGRDINPSELVRKVMEAGAKRVNVVSPSYTKVRNGSKADSFIVEIAVLNSKNISYGGVEDE